MKTRKYKTMIFLNALVSLLALASNCWARKPTALVPHISGRTYLIDGIYLHIRASTDISKLKKYCLALGYGKFSANESRTLLMVEQVRETSDNTDYADMVANLGQKKDMVDRFWPHFHHVVLQPEKKPGKSIVEEDKKALTYLFQNEKVDPEIQQARIELVPHGENSPMGIIALAPLPHMNLGGPTYSFYWVRKVEGILTGGKLFEYTSGDRLIADLLLGSRVDMIESGTKERYFRIREAAESDEDIKRYYSRVYRVFPSGPPKQVLRIVTDRSMDRRGGTGNTYFFPWKGRDGFELVSINEEECPKFKACLLGAEFPGGACLGSYLSRYSFDSKKQLLTIDSSEPMSMKEAYFSVGSVALNDFRDFDFRITFFDRENLKYLVEALGDKKSERSRDALDALKNVSGENFGYDRKIWKQWVSGEVEHWRREVASLENGDCL